MLRVLNHSVLIKMGGRALRVSSLQAYAHFVPFCALCFAELLQNLAKETVTGKYFCLCLHVITVWNKLIGLYNTRSCPDFCRKCGGSLGTAPTSALVWEQLNLPASLALLQIILMDIQVSGWHRKWCANLSFAFVKLFLSFIHADTIVVNGGSWKISISSVLFPRVFKVRGL